MRFPSSKHAQQSSGEPEVVVACNVSHNASQSYISSIGSMSAVIYTKFYQITNHRSRENVKKYVINNDFDVTLPSGIRNYMYLTRLRYAYYNIVLADVDVVSIYLNPLMQVHKI